MNKFADKCDITEVHSDVVTYVKEKMPLEEDLYDVAELFKVFGDTTRIRILHTLSIKELCVCDIATILDMSQSAISHQLRVLKNTKLVKYRKEGKQVFYSLDDKHIQLILAMGFEHVKE